VTARILPGIPESVRVARQLVRSKLGAGHPAAEAAALAVSELATNAIAYTRSGLPGGVFAVSVSAGPATVLIRVVDLGSRTAPVLAGAAPGPGDEHGRGLAVVDAIADQWGSELTSAGRVTWCVFGCAAPAEPLNTGVHVPPGTRARAHAREAART